MSLLHFSSEHKMIQKEIRTFSETELAPQADDIDKKKEVPHAVIRKLSELGFLSLIVPEKYGGTAVDMTGLCIVLEELSKVSASVGTILAVQNCLVAYPLIHFSSQQLQDTYLPVIARGEVGAFITDNYYEVPDRAAATTDQSDGYTINGHRDLALNGAIGGLFVVQMTAEEGAALCILDKNSGITTSPNHLLGLKSAGIVGVEFNNTRVTSDSFLFGADVASSPLNEVYGVAHLGFAAVSVGIAHASLVNALKYSKERKQFHKAICEFPMVQEMLVDMSANTEMARLLVYDAAKRVDRGEPWLGAAHLAYLVGSRAAVHAGNKAIQIYGGYGYTKDYPVERFYRDAASLQVLLDTPDEIYAQIAKEVLS